MTCGNPECKKQWHRKRCAIWNRNNVEYYREIYLEKKLASLDQTLKDSQSYHGLSSVLSFLSLKLPKKEFQEVIGLKQLVIIEYFCQLLSRRFQEVIKAKVIVNTG